MTPEECFRIIEEAHALGVAKIAFSGGEPLIWPHILSAVELSSRMNIEATVYSTGNVDNQVEIISSLSEAGLKRVVFCLFASSEMLHDRITRKKGSYNQTISAIECCKKVGIIPELHFVATARNYKQLPEICNIAQAYGIVGISILRFVPQGRGKLLDKAILSKDQSKELISTIEHLRSAGFIIRTGSPMNVFHINNNPNCLAGVDRLIIAPNLRVYPCDAFKQIQAEEIVKTNKDSIICKDVSLSKCWSDSPYLNEVRDVLTSEPIGRCSSCIKIKTCNTGCLAQKYLINGSIDRGPDPACIFN